MKTLFLALILFASFSCATKKYKTTGAYRPTEDQYWNEMSNESTEAHARITDVIEENAPALYNQILLDAKDPVLPIFWGKSLNFDSGAKKIIVEEKIIEDLQRLFNIKNNNQIVHAGIMHTYGYLFSTINTPYGYKRKRWIGSTLNYAFGFSGNSLSPETIDGGLLSNITYFSGMLALSDKTQLNLIKNVSSEVVAFDYSKLKSERLEESTKDFTLVTTLVKLPLKLEKEENDYLLIYSFKDHRLNKELLITAFPITAESRNKITAKEALGSNQKITIRYNAYLDNVEKDFVGTRKLINQ